VSCGRSWAVASAFSLHEQQAVESCPCPECGAYTLCCHDPEEATDPGAMKGIVVATPRRG
jgi:hypothetical protein